MRECRYYPCGDWNMVDEWTNLELVKILLGDYGKMIRVGNELQFKENENSR